MARKTSAPPARRAPAPAPVAKAAPVAPPPAHAPSYSAPAPAVPQQSGGMLAGLGATMAQGFAFGTGSALAREAVGSIFGGSSSSSTQQAAPAAAPVVAPTVPQACDYDHKAFMSCLNQNPGNSTNCDHYYQALQACQTRV